jgi:hypothetical protein
MVFLSSSCRKRKGQKRDKEVEGRKWQEKGLVLCALCRSWELGAGGGCGDEVRGVLMPRSASDVCVVRAFRF